MNLGQQGCIGKAGVIEQFIGCCGQGSSSLSGISQGFSFWFLQRLNQS